MADSSTIEADLVFVGGDHVPLVVAQKLMHRRTGGTAAGVIAGRLAAADPTLKILLLEAGGHTKDQLFHTQPARFLVHLAPTSTTVKFYVGRESEHLGGRRPIVPVGACLGGGSSVNFTMYTRASASDYDDWKNIYGNEGWGYEDLLPLLKKVRQFFA
jgi:alcohol oxidase